MGVDGQFQDSTRFSFINPVVFVIFTAHDYHAPAC
jgi:hypothetical protein